MRGFITKHVTNRILDNLLGVLRPRQMTLVAAFTARGGIRTTVTVKAEGGGRKAEG